MRLILLGYPGSGKGTQASLLEAKYDLTKISTGDLLRSAVKTKTRLGEQIQNKMNAGELVPDDLVIQGVLERIRQPDCKNGFILDGFPRTLAQAKKLTEEHINIDFVIHLSVDKELLVQRIAGRLIHMPSGRVYHMNDCPPQQSGLDDVTGEPLVQRQDDNEQTVRRRLQIYAQEAKALIAYYKQPLPSNTELSHLTKLIEINGIGSIEAVLERLETALNMLSRTHS